jgi:hypothetical protein
VLSQSSEGYIRMMKLPSCAMRQPSNRPRNTVHLRIARVENARRSQPM